MDYFVYHLFVGRKRVYVGRSNKILYRQRAFERRTKLIVTRVKKFICSSFEEACKLEIIHLQKYKTPYNLWIHSSPAWFGKKHSEETKRKIGRGNRGKRRSKLARKKMSESVRKAHSEGRGWGKGRHHSKTAKNKIRKSKLGVRRTNLERKRISRAVRKAYREGRMPDVGGKNHPMWGKTHSAKVKREVSVRVRWAWKRATALGDRTRAGFSRAMKDYAAKHRK